MKSFYSIFVALFVVQTVFGQDKPFPSNGGSPRDNGQPPDQGPPPNQGHDGSNPSLHPNEGDQNPLQHQGGDQQPPQQGGGGHQPPQQGGQEPPQQGGHGHMPPDEMGGEQPGNETEPEGAKPRGHEPPPSGQLKQSQGRDYTQDCRSQVITSPTRNACQAFKDCCRNKCTDAASDDAHCDSAAPTLPGTETCTCGKSGASGLTNPRFGFILAAMMVIVLVLEKFW